MLYNILCANLTISVVSVNDKSVIGETVALSNVGCTITYLPFVHILATIWYYDL